MFNDILKVKRAVSSLFMLSFLAVIVSLPTGHAFGDVETDLEQAYIHIENQQYSQVQKIYEGIIRDYPSTERALRAQTDHILMNVNLGRLQEAQASLERLMSDFPVDEIIAEAILEVALGYLNEEQQVQSQKTIELCEQLLANWHTSEDAIWAQAGIVKANILLGNDRSAQSAFLKTRRLNVSSSRSG